MNAPLLILDVEEAPSFGRPKTLETDRKRKNEEPS